MMKTLIALTIASVAACNGADAQAQNWPTRPVTMVVPLPASSEESRVGHECSEPCRYRLVQDRL